MHRLKLNFLSFAVLFLGFSFVVASSCKIITAREYHDHSAIYKDSLTVRIRHVAMHEVEEKVTSPNFGGLSMSVDTGGKEIKDATGTIRLASPDSDWYGIAPDHEEGVMYAPSNLPAKFRKDGLKIRFSGKVGEVPPNVRMWGIPLELTKIEKLSCSGSSV